MSRKITKNKKHLKEQAETLLEFDPEEVGRNQDDGAGGAAGDDGAGGAEGGAYDDREDPGFGATNPDNQEMGGNPVSGDGTQELEGCSQAAMEVAKALQFSDLEKHALCKEYPEPPSWIMEMVSQMSRELGVGTLVHTILQMIPGSAGQSAKRLGDTLAKFDVGGRFGSALNIGFVLFELHRIWTAATWKDSKEHNQIKRKIGISTQALYKDLQKINKFRQERFDKNKRLDPNFLKSQEAGRKALSFVHKFDADVSILTSKKAKVSFTKANKFINKEY